MRKFTLASTFFCRFAADIIDRKCGGTVLLPRLAKTSLYSLDVEDIIPPLINFTTLNISTIIDLSLSIIEIFFPSFFDYSLDGAVATL